MAEAAKLSERKAAILSALVHVYIRTGEPVGSEAVATAARLGVSSATIRNELAALEELGYLSQPHTSAGRVPTDLAYRCYVDALPPRPKLPDPERRAVLEFFDEALADVDEILRGTTQLLSRLTHYASLALAPSRQERALVRLELLSLGQAMMLLAVLDTGRVDKCVIDLPQGAGEADVERVSRGVLERLRGQTLGEARAHVAERGKATGEPERAILARVDEALATIGRQEEGDHVVVGGAANIAGEDSFARRETLRHIFEALERETEVLGLLRQATVPREGPVSVTIGRESPMTGQWEASVVAAPYGAGDRAFGTIGVVGPIRMDYLAAISAVRVVAERLSAAVEALTR